METPLDMAENVRNLRAELKIFKADNERLIKDQENQSEINMVLLQSLSDIQRKLQHEHTTNHADRQHKKRGQSPPQIWKHDSISDLTGRSTMKKFQPRGKGHSSRESYGKEDDKPEGSSSSRAITNSQRKGKKQKHSKTFGPEEFKKDKPPSFDREINKGEETKAWLFGLKKYFRVHD